MAEKAKTSDKDKALVNILERVASELQKQGALLDDIIKKQSELSSALRSAEYQRGSQQNSADDSLDRIRESIAHYRAGMLSLVNEQDQINGSLKELRTLMGKTVYSLELNNKSLEEIDGRIKAHEKAMNTHYESSQKQGEAITKDIAESGRNVARLHADTEKRLGELHRETQKQIDRLNQDTTRRLLALSGIESALEILLIRTEPPEKKPLLIARLFGKVRVLFKIKLPLFFKRVFTRKGQ